MKEVFDLRVVIGAFFVIMGIVLIGYGLVAAVPPDDALINQRCGAGFVAFGAAMIFLWFRKPGK